MPFTTPFTTRPEIHGTFGVVTSTHWLASATGMNILEHGGNAFDAAVAMGLALQVVEPHLNGPAGEVPMLVYSAGQEKLSVVCGQGVAPAAATIDRFETLGLDMIPGTGLLAACTPGAFDAWMLVLQQYGTMRLADIIGPAIAFAENGYPLVAHISNTIESVEALFHTEWPSSAEIYLRDGAVPAPGSLFRNPALAGTFKRVLSEVESTSGDRDGQIAAARRAFSSGFIAEEIDRFCATQEVMDTSERRHKGLLTGDDMARWQARLDEPLTYDYGGYTVAKAGPWSQGPVYLQQLALLKGFDMAAMDPVGPDFIHTCVECAKLAYADREAYYGDPDFADVPIDYLLSDGYNDARRRLVCEDASFELRPGDVPGYRAKLPKAQGAAPQADAIGAGEPTMATGYVAGDTCHLDVIDSDGNMVSATPSGGWLQSSPVIPRTRLLSRHASADVLVGARPAGKSGTGQTAAHHPESVVRLPRRRTLYAVRHAGR